MFSTGREYTATIPNQYIGKTNLKVHHQSSLLCTPTQSISNTIRCCSQNNTSKMIKSIHLGQGKCIGKCNNTINFDTFSKLLLNNSMKLNYQLSTAISELQLIGSPTHTQNFLKNRAVENENHDSK